MAYTLTIRLGPRVERERFDELEAAIAAMRERVSAIRAGGGLEAAQGLREYEPGERVDARLELATGSWRRGRAAGMDVMGDGALVPYTGAIHKRRLEPASGEDPFDAIHEAMASSVGSEP